MTQELDAIKARLDAVLAIHVEDVFRGHLSNGCKVCGGGVGWPCPTVIAITGGKQ